MIEHKIFAFDLKALTDDGTFEGMAAVYGNEDLGGDIIDPGCFKRSVQHKNGKFPILAAHDPTQEVGIALVEETDAGLKVVRGQLYLHEDPRQEIQAARTAYIRMKRRQEASMPMGMSIGYETLQAQYQSGVRHLKEAKLWEVSVDVTFPMNPLAGITAVKAVSAFQDLPLAPRDRAWDGTAAEGRVRTWAGADDGLDTPAIQRKYARAFLWRDGEAPDAFGSYKLQYADLIDGTLTAIPRALFAIAGILQGARGGLNVPDTDKARLKTLVARWYKKMAQAFDDDTLVPPWEQENAMPSPETKQDGAQTFAQVRTQRDLYEERYDIDMSLWQSVWSIMCDDALSSDQKLLLLRTSLSQFNEALMAWAQAYLGAETGSAMEMMAASHFALHTASYLCDAKAAYHAETKAGRVLSRTNRDLITQAIAGLQALLDVTADTAASTDDGHADGDEGKAQAPATDDKSASVAGDHADAADDDPAEAEALQSLLTAMRASIGSSAA